MYRAIVLNKLTKESQDEREMETDDDCAEVKSDTDRAEDMPPGAPRTRHVMSQDTSLDDESIKLAEAAAVPLPSDVEDSNDDENNEQENEEVESAVTQQVESTKRRKSPKRYSKLGDDFGVSGLPVELRDDPKMYKYWKQRQSLFHRTKMSNIKTDRGLSYTIPVDSVDLKYLSKYVSSTGMLPLWTKTRLNGEAGYCQVQILAQNDEECYSEPADTYECHICNLHVPVTCSKEHNDSECHKTIKNIYQIVLEKLSKQMDTSIVKHDEKIDKDAYYCVPCSKIIKKENKDKHESSEFHAKSNKDTIIISEFYKIINEDKSPTDNIILNEERLTQDSDLEPVNTKSYIENNNYAITLNKLNNNYLDIGHDESTDLPTYANKLAKPGPSKIQPPNDNKIQPPNDEKAETFKDYLEAMIKKYKLKVNVPVMTSEDIYLESSNGETVIVCPEHFQSYRQSKNRVYCQLCNMWISQDTKPHDVTEYHVRNIFKPINENFARTIDSVSSHCVPCNYVVLTDFAQHTLDDNHRKIIKDTRVQKVGKTYCEDCNLYIDTHNFSVHIISKKHLNGIMIKHSIIKTENLNVFFCKLCNLTISKNGIKNHVVARTHLIKKTNGASKLSNNGDTDLGNKNTDSSKINDKNTKSVIVNDKNTAAADIKKNINNSKYCKICKVDVPIGEMEIHVDGKAHKKQINQLNKFNIKNKENKVQNSYSRSASTSTTKIDSLASTSTSSSISKAEIKNDLSDAKLEEYSELLEFADDSKTELRCKICMIDSVSSHCVPCNYVVLTDSAQHTLDDNHRKIIKDTRVQKVGKTYCEDCNLYIDTHNFSAHIKSKKHLNGVMIKHSIIKTENSNVFFCKLCNLTVSKNGLENHVVARTHLINKTNDATKLNKNGATGNNDDASKINNKNTKTAKVNDKNTDSSAADIKTNNSEYCKICKVKVPVGGMETHVDGKAHKKKLDEYYKFLSYTDDTKTKVNCEICYVNIPKVDRNIVEHMEGRNHEIAVTGLLKFHLITKESSWYLCECCEVKTTDYLEHINSKSHTITFLQKYEIDKTEMRKYVYESDVNDVVARRHRVRYQNLLKHNGIYKLNDTSYYCGMCQIKLGRISELDHVLGEKHALKLAAIEKN